MARWIDRIKGNAGPRAPGQASAGWPRKASELLNAIYGHGCITRRSEAVTEEGANPAAQELADRLERAAAAGLTVKPSPALKRTSERLLAARFLCMQYERLVDETAGPDQASD